MIKTIEKFIDKKKLPYIWTACLLFVYLFIPIMASAQYTAGYEPGYTAGYEPGYTAGFEPAPVSFALEPVSFIPSAPVSYGYDLGSVGFSPGSSNVSLTRIGFSPGSSNIPLSPIGFTPGVSNINLSAVGFSPGSSNISLSPVGFSPGSSAYALTPVGFSPGFSSYFGFGPSVAFAQVPATGIVNDGRVLIVIGIILLAGAALSYLAIRLFRNYQMEQFGISGLPDDFSVIDFNRY